MPSVRLQAEKLKSCQLIQFLRYVTRGQKLPYSVHVLWKNVIHCKSTFSMWILIIYQYCSLIVPLAQVAENKNWYSLLSHLLVFTEDWLILNPWKSHFLVEKRANMQLYVLLLKVYWWEHTVWLTEVSVIQDGSWKGRKKWNGVLEKVDRNAPHMLILLLSLYWPLSVERRGKSITEKALFLEVQTDKYASTDSWELWNRLLQWTLYGFPASPFVDALKNNSATSSKGSVCLWELG